ncbi:MAG: DNA repair protein RecO [Burkholderiales bacterium]|jgi:DNA repair protein RecO (recombination protein O)|nr:DNA repair protein RecO [Burkholderiales bacterium]
MNDRARVDNAQAFVLHSYPYRETSLIVEAYSRAHGRVALIARGARRPRAALRGALIQFQPLLLSWAGKGELRTLMRAEWIGGRPMLRGDALLCGFYLNELLLKLLPREDPHEALFDRYVAAIDQLCASRGMAEALRGFEKQLLAELGYALTLDLEAHTGERVDPAQSYTYELDRGPVKVADADGANVVFSGRALIGIARDDYSDPETAAQSKALMRLLINHRLESQALHSRRIFADLQAL